MFCSVPDGLGTRGFSYYHANNNSRKRKGKYVYCVLNGFERIFFTDYVKFKGAKTRESTARDHSFEWPHFRTSPRAKS